MKEFSAFIKHLEKFISIESVKNAPSENAPFGKEIRLKLSVEKRKVMLRVYNEGDGIEKEKLPKLFDRFYRADESHSVGGSFGLGLAIAKAIVDSMDGRIGVDSEVAKYTEFICVFKES